MPFVGAQSPEALEIEVMSTDGFDISAVTRIESMDAQAGKLTVRSPSGILTTWSFAMSGQTSGSVVLTHVYAVDGSDVGEAGEWRFYGWMVTPSARRRISVTRVPFSVYG